MKKINTKRSVGRPRASKKPISRPARESILLASATLFAEQGFSETTTRQISDKVGIRQPSLFYHFSKKQDIMLALIEEIAIPWQKYINSLQHKSGKCADKLYQLMRYDFHYLADEPFQIGKLLILPEIRHGQFSELAQDLRNRIFEAYKKLIKQGSEDGVFEVSNLDITTHTVFGMGETLWSWYKPGKDGAPDAVAENIADLAMRGLLRKPGELATIKKNYQTQVANQHS